MSGQFFLQRGLRARGNFLLLLAISLLTAICAAETAPAVVPEAPQLAADKAALGGLLFSDPALSNPPGQSCATCHRPDRAFAEDLAVSVGVASTPGVRNAPSLMYAQFSPAFMYEEWRRTWVGGQFWDGRADTLAEQALGPLLNPAEMNNTRQTLAASLRGLSYRALFEKAYGKQVFAADDTLILAAADALQRFQMTDTFAPFTSKFDYAERGLVQLTEQEKLGAKLFDTKAACMDCHAGLGNNQKIFTGFSYHNILTPANPALNAAMADIGLALNTKVPAAEQTTARGRFKTPTLRNIVVTGPYMHNGVFKTLREVIEYYNAVDDRERWGQASFPENQSHMLKTRLELTGEEIEALLAFLQTLTDGYPLPSNSNIGAPE